MHIATEENREMALCYILAWGGNPFKQDERGDTPLHIAVKRVHLNGNQTRIIRILLLKGSSREIRNREGLLPIECIPEPEYDDPQDEMFQR